MSHQVLEKMPDTKPYRNRKLVKSARSGDVHTIAIRKSDNRWTCSCKDWIFRRSKAGTDCDHIREIRETYGDRARSVLIMERLTAFSGTQNTWKRDPAAAMTKWIAIRQEAEMLHLFYENDGKEEEAKALGMLIANVQKPLAEMVLS